MKNIKKLIGIILCALIVTGCELKYEGKVEITKDGKMDMSVIMAYDRELANTLIYMENNDNLFDSDEDETSEPSIPEASITEIRNYLEKNKPESQDGLEVSRYEKNGYYGYQMSYEIENIDLVSSKDEVDFTLFSGFNIQTEDEDTENDNDLKDKKMFKKDGDTYYAKYKINDDSQSNENSMGMSMLNLSLNYTVTLPTKPIKHNADTVSEDGKTLTWNIDSLDGEREYIEYSFKLKETPLADSKSEGLNTEMIMLIAGIVIIVIIIIVVLVLFARNNKKLDKSLEVLDQTIPSGTPKQTEQVMANTNIATTTTSIPSNTPIVAAPTEVVNPVVQNVVPEVAPNVNPTPIETVPVIESIPVTNVAVAENTNNIAQETKTEEINVPKEENKTNLDEMPIIMEPGVNNTNIEIPTQQVVTPTPAITEEIINTPVEPVVANETINQTVEPVIENIPIQEIKNIQPEPKIEEETKQPELNIFDIPVSPTSNVINSNLQPIEQANNNVSEIPKEVSIVNTIEEPVKEPELNTEVPQEMPNNTIENNVITQKAVPNSIATEQSVVVSTPEPTNVVNNTVNTTPINTVEIPSANVNVQNIVNNEVNNTEPQVPEVKLEVLDNVNTTLEEPNIPLPEIPVQPMPTESTTLEPAPVVEEPAGNKFIQTEFIETNKETTQGDNTNL